MIPEICPFLEIKRLFLLKNKNGRKKIGRGARKVIEEKNNYYKEMKKMEETYFNL